MSDDPNLDSIWLRMSKILLLSITVVLGAISGLAVFDKGNHTAKESPDVKQRLAQLNTVQTSLQQLSAFVDNQKQSVLEANAALAHLNEERAKLEEVTKADRRTVETLFTIHEERSRRTITTERIISFLLGVLSSLVATAIWVFVSRRKLKQT